MAKKVMNRHASILLKVNQVIVNCAKSMFEKKQDLHQVIQILDVKEKHVEAHAMEMLEGTNYIGFLEEREPERGRVLRHP